MQNEEIINCPKSGGDLCYKTQLNPEITTYMSLSCGFWTNSFMTEDHEFYKQQIETLPEMRYLLVRTSIGTRSNFEAHRIITVQPDLADVQVLGERVREAERIVQERDFRKNTGWNLCSEKWCPYYERCILTGELSGDPEEILSQIVGDSDTQ